MQEIEGVRCITIVSGLKLVKMFMDIFSEHFKDNRTFVIVSHVPAPQKGRGSRQLPILC